MTCPLAELSERLTLALEEDRVEDLEPVARELAAAAEMIAPHDFETLGFAAGCLAVALMHRRRYAAAREALARALLYAKADGDAEHFELCTNLYAATYTRERRDAERN